MASYSKYEAHTSRMVGWTLIPGRAEESNEVVQCREERAQLDRSQRRDHFWGSVHPTPQTKVLGNRSVMQPPKPQTDFESWRHGLLFARACTLHGACSSGGESFQLISNQHASIRGAVMRLNRQRTIPGWRPRCVAPLEQLSHRPASSTRLRGLQTLSFVTCRGASTAKPTKWSICITFSKRLLF